MKDKKNEGPAQWSTFQNRDASQANLRERMVNLIDTSLFTLGWIMGKHGEDAEPVVMLARALQSAGSDCTYIQAILDRAGHKTPAVREEPRLYTAALAKGKSS